jgi:hypothetical protein
LQRKPNAEVEQRGYEAERRVLFDYVEFITSGLRAD